MSRLKLQTSCPNFKIYILLNYQLQKYHLISVRATVENPRGRVEKLSYVKFYIICQIWRLIKSGGDFLESIQLVTWGHINISF